MSVASESTSSASTTSSDVSNFGRTSLSCSSFRTADGGSVAAATVDAGWVGTIIGVVGSCWICVVIISAAGGAGPVNNTGVDSCTKNITSDS